MPESLGGVSLSLEDDESWLLDNKSWILLSIVWSFLLALCVVLEDPTNLSELSLEIHTRLSFDKQDILFNHTHKSSKTHTNLSSHV